MIRYHAKVDPLTYYEPARKTDEHESGETSEEENVANDVNEDKQVHGQREKIYGNDGIYEYD